MSRRATRTDAWWERAMATAIAKINFNTIFLAVIATAGGFAQYFISAKQDAVKTKQEQTAVVDSSWKVSNREWKSKVDRNFDSLFIILKSKK